MSEVTVDTTRISERGQVVIPKDVRDRLGLKIGTRLLVVATSDAIVLQKVDLAAERLRAWDLLEKARAIVQKLGLKK
ncbi:MAG: AbrB/MazE/SpoVT family DNA-binding domain-containing protein [Thaumarchaeota archaeon]|jgi:AbrB family looped-hinge helix DNA binding protein|nr:AbrB/MazE/SpoVT family DNA-binding domain-containing protein [Nitrososphaerota archaeon]